MALLLRIYSYVFHILFSLFLLGLALVGRSPGQVLRLNMLPWSGDDLIQYLLTLGVVGLILTLLAITGLFPYLFPVWALFVLIMVIRGYFLQSYIFSGPGEFQMTLFFAVGTLVAFLASLTVFRKRKRY